MVEILRLRKDVDKPGERFVQTLRVGAIGMVLITLVLPSIERAVEGMRDLDGSFSPEVKLIESYEHGVMVIYDAGASYPVRAHFTVQTRTDTDEVLCTYRSINRYAYSPNTSRTLWRWHSWAEQKNAGSCDLPEKPSRVCLRYDGQGKHGAPFDTPYYCFDYPQKTRKVR